MNEGFDVNIRLLLTRTVRAALRSAIDKRAVRAREGWAGVPICRVLGDLANEEQYGEAPAELILLDMDARCPGQVGTVGGRSGQGAVDTDGLRILLVTEGERGKVRIELVDLPSNFAPNGVRVSHVEAVEFWVGVS